MKFVTVACCRNAPSAGTEAAGRAGLQGCVQVPGTAARCSGARVTVSHARRLLHLRDQCMNGAYTLRA